MEEEGEYDLEQLRSQNLQDNKEVLAKLMKGLKDFSPHSPSPVPHTNKKVSRKSLVSRFPVEVRRNPSRSSRYRPYSQDASESRNRRASVSSGMSSNSSESSSPDHDHKLLVQLGGFCRFPRPRCPKSGDGEDWEEEEDFILPKKKKYPVRDIKAAEDITEDELKLVANSTSEKHYDPAEGSTCHQCRQKTDDMKTICRSEYCRGIRGQFCGPCLRNRYGEDIKKSLKNPQWICPPCRGICNCSFCRRKSGKTCTGILIHLAREQGFSDVNTFLESFKE